MLDLSAIGLATAVPAHGLTIAMCLTLMGMLNYVAYGDIFDGRRGQRVMSTGDFAPFLS